MVSTQEISSSKTKFIDDQIYSLTLMATTQRSRIYCNGSSEEARQGFRKGLQRYLEARAKDYLEPVTSEQHLRNIESLSVCLTDRHGACLRDGRFRIGLAQKALNLYLKYLWCLGRIDAKPPHCPIDRIVLEQAKYPRSKAINWTDMKSMDEYLEIIQHVSEEANRCGQTLATWELDIWAKAKELSQ